MCKNLSIKNALPLIYAYLTVPIVIFFLGWCRWYIGIPTAIIVSAGALLSLREHWKHSFEAISLNRSDGMKLLLIFLIVSMWVVLSGIGGYTWQNTDHYYRNGIYEMLVRDSWPVAKELSIDSITNHRALIYYIGFWLPAALFGKIFGLQAGYAFQYVWVVLGILITYALICLWRKRILVWPLFIFILFSGLDAAGTWLSSPDKLEILGENHLEWWAPHYQFSSISTQLFWVFNQAVPAWVASIFILLFERPKNMIFTASLIMLTSIFPFVGVLPFAAYFMISRSAWAQCYNSVVSLYHDILKNCGSIQNIIAGGCVGVLSTLYLLGNEALRDSLTFVGRMTRGQLIMLIIFVGLLCILVIGSFTWVCLHLNTKWLWCLPFAVGIFLLYRSLTLDYGDGHSAPYLWMNLNVFFFLEAGIYLLILHGFVRDHILFWITAGTLYLCPMIVVGTRNDFCMRVSIPALFLVLLWCIQKIDEQARRLSTYILLGVLIIGAITPFHEIRRTYVNSRNSYEQIVIDEDTIFTGYNFSGNTDNFFWKYIAR